MNLENNKFLYCFNAVNTEFFKIGVTKNIKYRLIQIQTGCPLKIRYVHSVYTSNCQERERELHKYIRKHHTIGEWYELPFKSVKKVIQLMNLISEKTLNIEIDNDEDNSPILFPNLTNNQELELYELITQMIANKQKKEAITGLLKLKPREYRKGLAYLDYLDEKYG